MERSVSRLVSILHRKNQVYLDLVLSPLNITAAELPVLSYLLDKDGVSQEELTNWLAIDKAATARTVMSLTGKGYLRKEKNPDDHRANRIHLTEMALEEKAAIRSLLRQWSVYLMEEIDTVTLNAMYTALDSMVEKVNATDIHKKWAVDDTRKPSDSH